MRDVANPPMNPNEAMMTVNETARMAFVTLFMKWYRFLCDEPECAGTARP